MKQGKKFHHPVRSREDTSRLIAINDIVEFILDDGSTAEVLLTEVKSGGRWLFWDHGPLYPVRAQDVRAVTSNHHPDCEDEEELALPAQDEIVMDLDVNNVDSSDGVAVDEIPPGPGTLIGASAAGAVRPTYVESASNSLPALNFDGGNDYMVTDPVTISDNVTVIAVFSVSSLGASRKSVLGHEEVAGRLSLEAASSGFNAAIPGVFIGQSGDLPETVADEFRVVKMTRRGASLSSISFEANGINLELTAEAADTWAGTYPLSIGRRSAAIAQYLPGRIQRILIWSRDLTEEEERQATKFLQNQWQSHLPLQLWLRYEAPVVDLDTGGPWVQGIARDENYYYTTQVSELTALIIRKWTRTAGVYNLVQSWDKTSDLPNEGEVDGAQQMNGISYFGGFLWMGCNNYVGPATPNPMGWIMKYDPSDMSLVATYQVSNNICEGGAWRVEKNTPLFYLVFHESNRYEIRDMDMNLIEEGVKPNQGRPGAPPESDNFYQGAVWFRDFFLCTNHNATLTNIMDYHTKNPGAGFSDGARIQGPVPHADGMVGTIGQGLCWDLAPGVKPEIGSPLLIVRRVNNGQVVTSTLLERRVQI